MKFIKIKILNPQTKENDTETFLRVDQIIEIRKASRIDKNTRAEMHAVVTMLNGTGYATDKTCEQILDEIEETELT